MSPKPKVLIVDDDPENLRILMNALQEDYAVVAASDGRRALGLAEKEPRPACILLDIMMPDIDGYEVCRRLKADENTREIPILFVSARTETDDKIRGLDLGAQDYITKPFNYDEVLARVRTHVSLFELQQTLRRQNEQLVQLEKERETLTQMIVHDMRSPLMVIMGNLEIARMDLGDDAPPGVAASLDAANRAADAVRRMAEDLLDIARLETGHMPVDLKACDLDALCRQAVAQAQGLADGQAIALQCVPGATALADPRLVTRVLQNLLTNAIKFSPAGRGIDSGHAERIFDKFCQTEASDQRHGKGLGLAFCKLAVNAHGGAIGVHSRPGVGTEFWFTLPAHAEN